MLAGMSISLLEGNFNKANLNFIRRISLLSIQWFKEITRYLQIYSIGVLSLRCSAAEFQAKLLLHQFAFRSSSQIKDDEEEDDNN
jgi:hypothetical protein